MCPGSTTKVMRLDGRARELVEAKLRLETARLDDAESKLRTLEDDAENLELLESQREWFSVRSATSARCGAT